MFSQSSVLSVCVPGRLQLERNNKMDKRRYRVIRLDKKMNSKVKNHKKYTYNER